MSVMERVRTETEATLPWGPLGAAPPMIGLSEPSSLSKMVRLSNADAGVDSMLHGRRDVQ